MSWSVDLNADLGEGAGRDDEILALVSSANIACGFHAGDATMMRASVVAAKQRGVAVGAHPSFDDREHFGRREMDLARDEIFALVTSQLEKLQALAHSLGVRPQHMKPHGALYNMASRDGKIADAIAQAVQAVDPTLIVFAQGGSELMRAAEKRELRVAREVFADRNYLPDGTLVPRNHPEALLHDPEEAAQRVFGMVRDGRVRAIDGTEVAVQADTICVHGDTPDAVAFVRALRRALANASVVIVAPRTSA